ncbi:DDE-type integrase/transposase/recombinase [Guyparkeria hydrothermalis]|uniref:Mu transposase C-terminal domain-containing protein n=1 Tax=Guyparkeria TaxID=2035712 RepID=UPI000F64E29D|nr:MULTISPECIES: Mu transposase C-terminal domain-containing protein [Guyparkeria]MCL7751796.1 DDE-type integrase/transposase/recombinase [Guyparkeria hydrothermalis]RRQ23606.1 hypothetical protein D5687_06710 [Guyparkeria sp. SCN-R1]
MSRYQFTPGHHIAYRGGIWHIDSSDPNTQVLRLRRLSDGQVISMPMKEAVELLVREAIEFVSYEEATTTTPNVSHWVLADFASKPAEQKKKGLRRLKYVQAVNELNLESFTEKTLTPVIANVAKEIGDPKPPSWISLYRWIRAHKQAGSDIRALLDDNASKGNRRNRLSQGVTSIIKQSIDSVFFRLSAPSVASVYEDILLRIHKENRMRNPDDALVAPSYRTVLRQVRKLDPMLITEKRRGKRAAEREFRAYGQGVVTTRPLERVEIDHTQLDMFVIDDESHLPLGRPYLTVALDHFTRSVVGFYISFTPPSAISVMECLKHAILPKVALHASYPKIRNTWDVYGVFETLVVDNGKEFYSTAFEEACLQLGINIQYSPPRQPWYKSSIERYFGTVNRKLIDSNPGKSMKELVQLAEYNPAKDAVIMFSSLVEIMHMWVVDIYQQTFNERIEDTPSAKWRKAVEKFPPILPRSKSELEVVLGLQETRKIQPTGVQFEGLRYNSPSLAHLRRRLVDKPVVDIKIDPSDISHIYVLDPIKQEYIRIPAVNQEYTAGKTLFQHQVIKNNAREHAQSTVNMAALFEAQERIQKVIENDRGLIKKRKGTQKLARFNNVSQKTKDSRTGPISEESISRDDLIQENETNQEETVADATPQSAKPSEDELLASLYEDTDGWEAGYTLKRKGEEERGE